MQGRRQARPSSPRPDVEATCEAWWWVGFPAPMWSGRELGAGPMV